MNQILSQTIWLVPCYALMGALLVLPWSPGIIRQTGPRPAGYINLLMTLTAFVHSLLVLPSTWHQPSQYLSFHWLQAANLNISFDLEISSVTVGALLLVTGLNLVAQVFAIGYLEMDWGWARFYSLLALFEGGMCTLVLCNSLFFYLCRLRNPDIRDLSPDWLVVQPIFSRNGCKGRFLNQTDWGFNPTDGSCRPFTSGGNLELYRVGSLGRNCNARSNSSNFTLFSPNCRPFS